MFLRKKKYEAYQEMIDRLKFENRELLMAHGVDLHERKRLGDEVAQLRIRVAELEAMKACEPKTDEDII